MQYVLHGQCEHVLCLAESSGLSLTVLTGRDSEREVGGESVYLSVCFCAYVCVTEKDKGGRKDEGKPRQSKAHRERVNK